MVSVRRLKRKIMKVMERVENREDEREISVECRGLGGHLWYVGVTKKVETSLVTEVRSKNNKNID